MGYHDTPFDEDYPCEVCGNSEEDCICPECPVCCEYGNPNCYLEHGLHHTEEQKFNIECWKREWEALARSYDAMAKDLDWEL